MTVSCLELGDVLVEVVADECFAPILRELLGPHYGPGDPVATLTIHRGDPSAIVPAAAMAAAGMTPTRWTGSPEVTYFNNKAVFVFHSPAEVTCHVGENERCESAEKIYYRYVNFLVSELLWAQGILTLHAAYLVAPDGADRLLLVGPSRSGKSTLAVALAEAGYSIMTDDTCLLRLRPDGGISLWTIRRPLHLDRSLAGPYPRLRTLLAGESYLPGRSKVAVDVYGAYGDRVIEQADGPTHLVIPGIVDEARTRCVAVSDEEARERLARSLHGQCILSCATAPPKDAFFDALLALPRIGLAAGHDARETPISAARFLISTVRA